MIKTLWRRWVCSHLAAELEERDRQLGVARAALRRQNEIQRAEIDALIDELHVARIWRDTLEQMLVTAGVGVAKEGASRVEAEATINRLIDWHIAMANDPRTTGVSA